MNPEHMLTKADKGVSQLLNPLLFSLEYLMKLTNTSLILPVHLVPGIAAFATSKHCTSLPQTSNQHSLCSRPAK